MNRVYVNAIASYAPGIPDWNTMREVFQGKTLPTPIDEPKYQPQTLPKNERRRAGTQTRLAFRLLESIAENAQADLSNTASIFASAGDYQIVHDICSVLTAGEKHISPTVFHNSVHNAASGYWGIATGCHVGSSSLSAYHDTFSAGLMEACIYALSESESVFFVAYDTAPPFPMSEKCPITLPFGVAFLLAHGKTEESSHSLQLSIKPVENFPEDPLQQLFQESATPVAQYMSRLLETSPVARCLPLLVALAQKNSCAIHFPGEPGLCVLTDANI